MELKTKLKEKLDVVREKLDFEKTGKFFREQGAVLLGSVLLVTVITVSVAIVGKQDADALGNESTPKYKIRFRILEILAQLTGMEY